MDARPRCYKSLPMNTESSTTPSAPDPNASPFSTQSLSREVLAGIESLGYAAMTAVQAAAIRPILEKRDVVVQSKTGTGKTAAFGIPLVELIDAGRGVQALVLTPTRELCAQVTEEVAALGRKKGVRVLAIYGGVSFDRQLQELKAGIEVVVATPGRLLDHLRRGSLRTDAMRIRVLDEADEMLSMGFWEDVVHILDQLPAGQQTLLFSATLPPAIEGLASRHLRDPIRLDLSRDSMTVDAIEHIIYYAEPEISRPRNLLRIIETERPETALIFCNTRDDVQLVGNFLTNNGVANEAISGELTQREREQVMSRAKAGTAKLVVATDVASRGIDIAGLSHVFNYTLPEDPEIYLHRVGRTGRIGRKGTAISLLDGRELVSLREIKKRYSVRFAERKLPSVEEVAQREERRRLTELAAQAASEEVLEYEGLAKRVLENHEAVHIVAFLLKQFGAERPVAAPAPPAASAPASAPAPAPATASATAPAPVPASENRDRERDRSRDRDRERERDRERFSRSEHDRDRGFASEPASGGGPAGLVRLHLNIGHEAGIDEEGLRRLVATIARTTPEQVHGITVLDRFSFVELADDAADTFIERAPDRHFGEIQLRAEPARERGPRGGGGRGPRRGRSPR